jgi:tRNA-binding EMAP/Myf-like protein
METAPVKPTISISDLEKVDVRVGTIESVEDVPSAELVKLVIDFGSQADGRRRPQKSARTLARSRNRRSSW